MLAVSSAWAQSYDSLESAGVRFATGATSATKVERMRITQGGLIGISNTAPIAKLDVGGDISTSGVIQVSGSALTCSSAIKGAMRYSDTSSTLEYCNSTAWTSLGPSATNVPAFHVDKNGTNQTVTAGVAAKMTWSTERFDTNSNFASDRFTATIPGVYLFTGGAYFSDATASERTRRAVHAITEHKS